MFESGKIFLKYQVSSWEKNFIERKILIKRKPNVFLKKQKKA